MDFFKHQEQARRHTGQLILLFTLAVISLILLSDLLVALFLFVQDSGKYGRFVDIPPGVHACIAIGITSIILLAIFYRLNTLKEGGWAIAFALGGLPIPSSTQNLDERQVLNVVEEMALAAGTPVPVVYVLEDRAINAFAAGYSPHDAVIGITRGAIELLNRDELQGVIAHEFSHILNGDMRLNLRLIAILFGILFIALAGRRLMHSAWYIRRGASAGLWLLGMSLTVAGYAGSFFAGMIKTAVSRQREFLADASAVQFTRNPGGIANALLKIGGWKIGSVLGIRNAAEYSHFYIARGISAWSEGLFQTHPPLEERIRRIDPDWDGQYPEVTRKPRTPSNPENASEKAAISEVAATVLTAAIAQTGVPTPEHIERARDIISRIPEKLLTTARDPEGAWAIALGLVFPPNASDWKAQIHTIGLRSDRSILLTLSEILPELATLSGNHRMPLLELCIPALRMLVPEQRAAFKQDLLAVIKADDKVELWEWALYRIFMRALEKPVAAQPRYNKPAHLAEECRLLLAAVAYTGADSKEQAESAFFSAASKLGLSTELPDKSNLRQSKLNLAVEKIRLLMPLEKPAVLKALCAAAEADGTVNIREVELIRAIADSIDCPMPPLATH